MSGYTNDCPRLGKWIGGCQYEARFSLPTYTLHGNGSAEGLIELAKVSRPLVYEGDVCVRCGKRASRDTPASQDQASAQPAKPHTQEPSP